MIGGALGALLALPVVLAMTTMAAPLIGARDLSMTTGDAISILPGLLWLLPVLLPVVAAAIGYLTTQVMMRRWLGQLP
jgi:hypothetical protein